MPTNLEKSALSGSSLDQWLATATSGLCDEARGRIEAEVRRHVDETVGALEAEGFSLDLAFNEAVRQLGNSRTARREFARTNLTNFEAKLLWFSRDESIREWAKTGIACGLAIAAVMEVFLVLANIFQSSKIPAIAFLVTGPVASVVLFAVLLAPFFLLFMIARWSNVRLAVAFFLMAVILVDSAIVEGGIHSVMAFRWTELPGNLLWGSVAAAYTYVLGRLWLKLGRMSRPIQVGN